MRINLRGQARNRNSIKQNSVCANYGQILSIVRNRQRVLVFARNQGPGASAAPAIERECCEKYHFLSWRRHGTFDRYCGADSRGTEAWIARRGALSGFRKMAQRRTRESNLQPQ